MAFSVCLCVADLPVPFSYEEFVVGFRAPWSRVISSGEPESHLQIFFSPARPPHSEVPDLACVSCLCVGGPSRPSSMGLCSSLPSSSGATGRAQGQQRLPAWGWGWGLKCSEGPAGVRLVAKGVMKLEVEILGCSGLLPLMCSFANQMLALAAEHLPQHLRASNPHRPHGHRAPACPPATRPFPPASQRPHAGHPCPPAAPALFQPGPRR